MLVLASCTNDESSPEQIEVGFNALTKKPSKAIELGEDAMFNDESTAKFKVWGFYSQTANPVSFTSETSSNFMNGVEISKVNAQWRNSAARYYWPIVGRVGFYALYPSSFEDGVSVAWNAGLKVDDYVISNDINHGDNAIDLMYSFVESGKTSVAAPLVFQHALSQLEFWFKQANYYEGAEIKVNSITLKNLYLKGDFTYIHKNLPDNSSIGWSFEEETTSATFGYNPTNPTNPTGAGLIIPNVIDNGITQEAAQFGESTLFLPQSIGSKKADLSITITQNGLATEAITYIIPIDLEKGTVTSWDMGKKYVYTINFNLDEILFDPEVSKWTDVEIGQIEL